MMAETTFEDEKSFSAFQGCVIEVICIFVIIRNNSGTYHHPVLQILLFYIILNYIKLSHYAVFLSGQIVTETLRWYILPDIQIPVEKLLD